MGLIWAGERLPAEGRGPGWEAYYVRCPDALGAWAGARARQPCSICGTGRAAGVESGPGIRRGGIPAGCQPCGPRGACARKS